MSTPPDPSAAALVPDDCALVVTGSLAAKVPDRTHERSQIRPVQVVLGGEVRPAAWFDPLGPHGIGALVVDADAGRAVCSTGDDLLLLDLRAGTVATIEVADLLDVHEIERDRDALLLANTGRDEVVVLAADTGAGPQERERLALAAFRDAPAAGEESVDRFHVNQVVVDRSGRRWALVHHVEGYQLLRKAATKVLKVQGDGGMVALDDGERRALRLTAPHSVTRVGDGWWIFDSGRSEVRRYDDAFEHVGTSPTEGWGRGAAVDASHGIVYAGMSPIRRRYLGVVPGRPVEAPCTVELLATLDGAHLGSIEIADIEQVNNVYLVPRAIGEAIVRFAP